MLLQLSRVCFWFAASAAAVALAVPTGRETLLTGLSLVSVLTAFVLWRSGLRELRNAGTLRGGAPDVLPLSCSALDDAALQIEHCCEAQAGFEPTLHDVASILKSELGALHTVVYRVLGADAGHARVSELIQAQPGFRTVERRVNLQRSVLGHAIASRREAGMPPGGVVVPVCARGGVVAAIEMNGIGITFDAPALAGLLTLARERLSSLAEPEEKGRRPPVFGKGSCRVGENG
jgi:hypothetical protein